MPVGISFPAHNGWARTHWWRAKMSTDSVLKKYKIRLGPIRVVLIYRGSDKHMPHTFKRRL